MTLCCSFAPSCPTLFDPMDRSTTGLPVLHHLPEPAEIMSIDSVMPSNHLILCCPLLLLPSIFSSELVLCIRWPKYWSFSFSINPSNEYSGLISFRIYWFDLLTVQGILKSCHINVHLKNLSKLVNFCVAILIMKMEGKKQHF